MPDSSDTRTDESRPSRRDYLVTAGSLGTGLAGGCLGADPPQPAQSDADPTATSQPANRREDFLWLGSGLWRDEAIRRNLFAFARRHDLAVVLVQPTPSNGSLVEAFRPPLEAASEFGLDVWLNAGLVTQASAETLVTDDDARADHLDRLRAVARLHGELFESGRIICWQEAPVMGQWTADGDWNPRSVDNLLEFGPDLFAAQQRAVAAANDALAVGIFVHYPYIVDSKWPEVFPELTDRLRAHDAPPDFGFTDFYRGWYEMAAGPEPANAAVRSLLSNARDALGDRPVFYLGQSHTINPAHTPSKQALRMNLRAATETGAAGIGWYLGGNYVPTKQGFDPFVPNDEGVDFRSDAVNTLTVARDRFLYAWLATRQAARDFSADDAFDLWLVGDEFGLYDHRLSVRTVDGAWEYLGDFGGYADGDYPGDSAVTNRATAFRGLSRERFLADGTLTCRVETRTESDGARLQAAAVMPCDPAAYVTEREIAAVAGGVVPLWPFQLGRTTGGTTLPPGSTRRVAVPVTDDGTRSLAHLRHPEFVAAYQRLASLEARTDLDPAARFDLWVRGSGLADPSSLPSLRDRDGTARAPAELGVTATTDGLAICHGLERTRFLDGDGLQPVNDADAAVEAVYAMPYAGTAAFRSPTRAAALLAAQPEEARLFSLDAVGSV
ncbi:hypothetical protein ACFR9U_05570 [Halorientalis brevis]|uniref:Uncharacterized protein n=1 Tax=Halorientalis brevis TaxID=1126241 RepID=A0ABD6C9Q9_9EURY|nr:hypothetical protein [Halorientalis brevis]